MQIELFKTWKKKRGRDTHLEYLGLSNLNTRQGATYDFMNGTYRLDLQKTCMTPY